MTENTPKVSPVYVPYATLLSALDALRNHGIPRSGVLDKSIWDTQSGVIQMQLILGFKFLGLIDDERKVLAPLPSLVAASTEERKPLLKRIIEEKYASVISQGITTISPAQMDEAFRRLGISGSTLDRAVRFFIRACIELGIPIAKRFGERARSGGPRKKRVLTQKRNDANAPTVDNGIPQQPNPKNSWEEQLLSKFPPFDPNWSDELQAKWFSGFERLMNAKQA